MRQRQRGEEAILSQTERSYFISIVHCSVRRCPFDLKTKRTRSYLLPLDGDSSSLFPCSALFRSFDGAQKQLRCIYSRTSTVNSLTKNSPFGVHYSLI